MMIRKQFTVNNTHIVRNCYSERCKYSLHAHTAVIETFFEGRKLDNAGMLMDFGITKNILKPFISMFQDTVVIWKYDTDIYKKFVKQYTDNWVEIYFTPSAELLSAFFKLHLSNIIRRVQFANNEDPELKLIKTRYHETRTGWAAADDNDAFDLITDQKWNLSLIGASMGSVFKERYEQFENDIGAYSDKPIIIEAPKQQVKRILAS